MELLKDTQTGLRAPKSMLLYLRFCFISHNNPVQQALYFITLEMGNLNHRGVKWPAQAHTAHAQRSWNSTQFMLFQTDHTADLEFYVLPHLL